MLARRRKYPETREKVSGPIVSGVRNWRRMCLETFDTRVILPALRSDMQNNSPAYELSVRFRLNGVDASATGRPIDIYICIYTHTHPRKR